MSTCAGAADATTAALDTVSGPARALALVGAFNNAEAGVYGEEERTPTEVTRRSSFARRESSARWLTSSAAVSISAPPVGVGASGGDTCDNKLKDENIPAKVYRMKESKFEVRVISGLIIRLSIKQPALERVSRCSMRRN